MEKDKAQNLLLFLQERSVVPVTVVDYLLEEQKTPEIEILGQNYFVKFKFHRNGKTTIKSYFVDPIESRHWNASLEETIISTITKNKTSDDLKKLKATHTHNSLLISGREDFLRRYPHLRLPEYYNISNKLSLSEDCGIDLVKNYVTGG